MKANAPRTPRGGEWKAGGPMPTPRAAKVDPESPEAKSAEETPYDDVPQEELVEEIHEISPEGEPGDPEVGPRGIGLLLLGFGAALLLIGVVVAVVYHAYLGVAAFALGVLLMLVNPQFWVAVLRARERARAKRHVAARHGHPVSHPDREKGGEW